MRKAGATLVTLIAISSVQCGGDTGTGTGLDDGTGAGKTTGGTLGVGGSTMTGSGGTIPGTGGSKGIGTGGTIPTTGGNSSAGTGVGASGAGGACTGQSATGMKGKSAVVMLLVDTSRSMTCGENDPPTCGRPAPAGQSKMEITQQALNTAIAGLPEGLGIGLVFYPGVTIGAMPCFNETVAVPIATLDPTQEAALTAAVNGAVADGSTPTFDAYSYALAQLQATTLEGDKYMVLITDGVPTYSEGCMGDGTTPVETAPIVSAAEAAMAAGVKTFVVGSPGSQGAKEALSAMARVGGTGPAGCMDTGPTYCHFDMTETPDFAGALADALGTITQQIPVGCNFEIPPPPNSADTIDTTRTNVIYNGMQIPYDQSCTAAQAWRFDDPVAPKEVLFCGTLCDQVNQAITAGMDVTVDVKFGCTRVDVPR